MVELTGNEILTLMEENADWLETAEDPAAMLAALVQVSELLAAKQPVAA